MLARQKIENRFLYPDETEHDVTLNCPSSSGLTAQEAAGLKRGSRSKSQYVLACLAGQGSLAASVLPVGIVPAQTSWPKLQALTDQHSGPAGQNFRRLLT